MNTKNLCEEEITLAPQTEIFEEAKRIAAESAGDATDSFVIKYDANQKNFLIAVLTELGCTITEDKDEANTMTATMNMEQAKFLINLECVKNIHKVLIRNYLEEEILEARAAEKEESAASVATPMMLSANEEEGVAVASVQTVAETEGSSMATAISLTLESWTTGCICCPGSEVWYKFTVSESKTYTVHTRGSLNMIGDLCNSAGTVLASDEDGIKCKMVADLTAGVTYYVKLKAHKLGETGGFYVRATERTIVDYVSMELSEDDKLKTVTLKVGDFIHLGATVYPKEADERRIFWYSFDADIADVEFKTGILKAKKVGTASVRVYDWYEHGRSDVIEVQVIEDPSVLKVKNSAGVALRSNPNANSAIINNYSYNTLLMLADEIPQNGNWFYVYREEEGAKTYGWCLGDDLLEQVTLITLNSGKGNINVRPVPGTRYNIIGKITPGDQVRLLQSKVITDESFNWNKILYEGVVSYAVADPGDFTSSTEYIPLERKTYNISSNGIEMLKELEGYLKTAQLVLDEVNYTIGYGHSIEGGGVSVVLNCVPYTELNTEEATALLMNDLNYTFIPKFNMFLYTNDITLNQNQYDACLMDCFQKGQNIWENQVRDIVKFIKNQKDFSDYDKVESAFIDGTTVNGLINRRKKEANLFVYGIYTYE